MTYNNVRLESQADYDVIYASDFKYGKLVVSISNDIWIVAKPDDGVHKALFLNLRTGTWSLDSKLRARPLHPGEKVVIEAW